MSKKIINRLYEDFKKTPRKLKIVCDGDEVIQAHEPYTIGISEENKNKNFSDYFENFGKTEPLIVKYSPYGSKIREEAFAKKIIERQKISKISPDLYQKQPFLIIAEELLKLIKKNKVEKLIFLSAYDKRKFPNGDERKRKIIKETFGKFPFCSLELIGFDSEVQGKTKADGIKINAADFDIMIDDNPYICRNIAEKVSNIKVISPYYETVAEKHYKRVLLVKNAVSDLKKEDF